MDDTGKLTQEEMQHDVTMIGIYSFYDKKSKKYDTPFYCQNDMFAGRHYKMVTDKEGTMIHTFKGDFDVYRIGHFDVENGDLYQERTLIITGKGNTNEISNES